MTFRTALAGLTGAGLTLTAPGLAYADSDSPNVTVDAAVFTDKCDHTVDVQLLVVQKRTVWFSVNGGARFTVDNTSGAGIITPAHNYPTIEQDDDQVVTVSAGMPVYEATVDPGDPSKVTIGLKKTLIVHYWSKPDDCDRPSPAPSSSAEQPYSSPAEQPAVAPASSTKPPAGVAKVETLPVTGATVWQYLLAALALIAGGIGLTRLARRRRVHLRA